MKTPPGAPTVVSPGRPRPLFRPRRAGGVPGLWSALAALAVLAVLGIVAPGGALAARAASLIPALRPWVLLGTAAALGALGALSGIRRLRGGGSLLVCALGLGLSLGPFLLAAALLVARLFVAAP